MKIEIIEKQKQELEFPLLMKDIESGLILMFLNESSAVTLSSSDVVSKGSYTNSLNIKNSKYKEYKGKIIISN